MGQREVAAHWRKRAFAELKGAKILFEKQDGELYGEVLFHCHLALELALKSQYILEKDTAAPLTHDLGKLSHELSIAWKQDEKEDFEEITDLAILSRYGDDEWYAEYATKHHAERWIQKAEKVLTKIFP